MKQLTRIAAIWLVAMVHVVTSELPAMAQERLPLPGTPTVYVQAIKPSAAKAPVVIMLHGSGGLVEDQAAAFGKWSAWLALQGVGSVIVDSFRGRGIEHSPRYERDRAGFMALLTQRIGDLRRAVDWARGQAWIDSQRIATFGQSQGAMVATLAALESGLTLPQISFYNGCDPRYFDSKPVPATYPSSLWLQGADDKLAPAANCEAMRARMGEAGRNIRIIVFARAVHTFDWEAPERQLGVHTLRYDRAADNGSRVAISEFLRAHRFVR